MADLEILDENGRDILHLICMSNNQEYLEILLAQDPPIFQEGEMDIFDDNLETPLMLAVRNGHASMVSKMLEMGCNPFV